jgi:anthranilate synthase/aminodeoxychorismate synthase-like glutamine amidotransferase
MAADCDARGLELCAWTCAGVDRQCKQFDYGLAFDRSARPELDWRRFLRNRGRHGRFRRLLGRAPVFPAARKTHLVIVIDNYDSFTYNLVQWLGTRRQEVRVFRNDDVTCADVAALRPSLILISPGPGSPEDAGISCAVIREFAGKLPIFGVCLGMQCIARVYGARIVRTEPVHGKTSRIIHDKRGIFRGLPARLDVMRYHSLMVEAASLPECLVVSARTADGVIMGLRHRQLLLEGVQFHPESILTVRGGRLLDNLLRERQRDVPARAA